MFGQALRWSILGIVVAIAAGAVYYEYQQGRPCVQPVHYTIGTVDSRFGISKGTLLADAQAAAAIWNKAAGKTVLEYDAKGTMPINLVYDAREANAQLGQEIATRQAEEDTTRERIDAEQAQFAAAQNAYNQKVNALNAAGGGTRAQVEELNQERAALISQENAINADVASYNASVATLNAVVAEYNRSAGTTFEEGDYEQDRSGKRINIFEFVNNTQLERVLAHEMGHAIGLGHNTNPKSIMYAENESGNLVPTVDDLAALKALCGS